MSNYPICKVCHNTGLEIYNIKELKIPTFRDKDIFDIRECNHCIYGTDARVHTMMHKQNDVSCECPYSYIWDYWDRWNKNE